MVVREMLYILVIITDLTISLVFTTFVKYKPKKSDFVHQTISCWEVCVGWAKD